eukprot:jgi/Ulvmu1/530/UM001_0538.1
MSEVLVELIEHGKHGQDNIAVITLNRPATKNAINRSLSLDLAAKIGDLRERKSVRAIVIMGAGGTFSAGVDLRDPMFADASLMNEATFNGPKNYIWQLRQVQVPLIAAVAGPCITGGMEIALNCDIIIASNTAFFRDTHTRYGIVPAAGMTSLLPKAIGLYAAKWMSLTGTPVPAQQAHSLGLVAKVLDTDSDTSLKAEAVAVAKTVCAGNAQTTQQVKRMINEGFGRDVDAGLAREGAEALSTYERMASRPADTRAGLASALSRASKL